MKWWMMLKWSNEWYWTYCGIHFMIYVLQIVMLCTLNLHSTVCQLYHNELEEIVILFNMTYTTYRIWTQPAFWPHFLALSSSLLMLQPHWLLFPLLEDSEGEGSLVCCSPRGCKQSDTTEWLSNSLKVQGLLPSEHLSDICSIIQVEDELGLN